MRYVVVGAGAVGGAIGGRLFAAGCRVTLVARGGHLDALRRHGLRLQSPDEDLRLRIPVAATPGQAGLVADDTVILATKTQDSDAALRQLAAVAPPQTTVVCAQNGVENERLALRHFARVIGMYVLLPSVHLEPGLVQVSCAPVAGVLDVGLYPAGSDATCTRLAADLTRSSFAARVVDEVMRWKYAKLLSNLGNALEAALGHDHVDSGLAEQARREALACYAAAGISPATEEEQATRWGELSAPRPVGGAPRGGGSSWQSLARSTGAVETDYLNGEIALLGRTHGVATPVNAMLQRALTRMAIERRAPGSASAAELHEEVRTAPD